MTVGKLRFVICVWFLVLSGSCLCTSVGKNSSLKVSSPENLKGTYDCAVSSFGLPQHGGTLTGVVVYPKVNQQAFNSFTHEFAIKTKARAGSLPVLLLLDDKDCNFTVKTRNAQNAGAAGIFIAYDELLSTTSFPEEEVDEYNMENLTIPSVLITGSLGDTMKKALYNGEFIRVNLEWTEAFTRLDDEQDDMNNNVDEFESNFDDQVEEHENNAPTNFMWRFMIRNSPFWGFMMLNVKSSLVFLFMGSEPTTI